MDFGEVLSRAWKVVWKHKILWLFGLLANCGGQIGSNFGNSVNYQFNLSDLNRWQNENSYNFNRSFNNVPDGTVVAIVIGFICLAVLVGLFFWALATFGRIGVIKGTQQVEGGTDPIAFVQLYRDSLPFMWRALGLSFLIGLAFFIVGIFVALIVFALTFVTFGLVWLCLIPLACLLVPLGWFVSILVQQMNVALVVEDLSIGEAITRGWEVVRQNIGNFIVMGLILVIGGIVVNFIFALPMVFVLAPIIAGLVGTAATESTNYLLGGGAVTLICFVLYLPVLLVAGGILRAYIDSSWTLTFLRATSTPPMEELPA